MLHADRFDIDFIYSLSTPSWTHTREFRDHELLRVRRGAGGKDIVSVAVETDALQQILRDLEGVGA